MNKSEIIEELKKKNKQLNAFLVEDFVESIFREMKMALVNGNRIEIRGFGSFYVRHLQARVGRNPRTGERVHVGEKKTPAFRMGKLLKQRMNKSIH